MTREQAIRIISRTRPGGDSREWMDTSDRDLTMEADQQIRAAINREAMKGGNPTR